MFSKKPDTEAQTAPATQSAPATQAVDLSGLKESAQAAQEAAKESAKNLALPPIPASVLTPESQASINAMLKDIVREAVAGLGPVLVQMDELRRRPSESERLVKAREERMAALMHTEEQENRANLERLRRKCPHSYVNGAPAINLIHNRPDRQVAGICVLCQEFIHPREWRIGPPDVQNPRGKPYIVEQHKDYPRVLQIEAQKT